jgi:DNA-binding NarL/FixJ family response regulator
MISTLDTPLQVQAERRTVRAVVADEPRARAALRLLLSCEPGVEVVGEAADAASLLACANQVRPDVVVLDWSSRDRGTGPALVAALRALASRPRIVALGRRPEDVQAARLTGVDAAVYKGDPPDQLRLALRAVVPGLS